jgi:DNA-binding transcriptional LysR family regulator
MERSQRVANLWNWLPHFRAVAETEHLPTASKAMNASASALSRSIRLLEEDIGHPLFDRVGRNLHLNADGQLLLDHVRRAMRLVHEGVQAASSEQLRGPILISIPGPFSPMFVLPVFEALRKEHPDLVPSIRSFGGSELPGMLKRGQLDIAVSDDDLETEGLLVEPLYVVEHAIFCSESHTLAGVESPSTEAVLAHPFVAPVHLPGRARPDAFPMSTKREVGLEVAQMNVAVEACKRGTYIGCFPVLVAEAAGLVRIPFAEMPSSHLYLLRRPPVAETSRTEVVAEAIKEAASRL